MATVTTDKDKKTCIGVKASKWNPKHDGCGRSLVKARNFQENIKSHDGYGNICKKCKEELEEMKIEFKAEQANAEQAKADKAKARKEDYKTRKAQEEKDTQKANEQADIERQLEIEQEKEQEEKAAEAKAAEEKEQAVNEALNEADDRPEVTWNQVKQVRVFHNRYESKLTNLTGLAKIDENIILFLHSILVNADPDDGLFSTREDIQHDMCNRFRVEAGATLKPFTWKAGRENYIETRKEQKGYDKAKDKPMYRTTHYNLTQTGIEWYQLWVETHGLPTPIVPQKLKVLAPKIITPIDGHTGSSDSGQMDNSIELALNDAQNGENAKDFYIDFLIDYYKNHDITHLGLGKLIGISGASMSLVLNKRTLSRRHYPKIKDLMNINKTVPVKFSTAPKEDDSVDTKKQTQPELPAIQPKVQPAIQPQVKPAIASSDDSDLSMQSKVLMKAITQAQKQYKKATKNLIEAQLILDTYANRIEFLENKFNQLGT